MKWSTFLRIMSRRPRRAWPDATLHHGARVLLLLGMAILTTMAFPVTPVPDFPLLEKGMVPEEDVIAEVPFSVRRGDQELARARQDAEAGVTPIFVYRPSAVDSTLEQLDGFFARVDSVIEMGGSEEAVQRRVRELLGAYGIGIPAETTGLLVDPRWRESLSRTVRSVVRQELPRRVARSEDLADAESRTIRLIGPEQDRLVEIDSVGTGADLRRRAELYLPRGADAGFAQLQDLLLVRFLIPSVQPDEEATERTIAAARAAVPTVREQVLKGSRVIAAREPVTEDDLERLRAYQQELEREGLGGGGVRGKRTLGAFLFNLVILSLFGALLLFYRPAVYRELRQVLTLAFLGMSVIMTAAVVAAYTATAPVSLVPIAFPALVIATLWDGRLALNLSLVLAVLLTGQAPFLGITALLTLVAAGAVASLSVRVVRRRAQAWVFIGLITGAYVLAAVVLGLLRDWGFQDVVVASGWGTLNAVASAFAAMGFLPLFEGFTRITTDQTLLELADSNRPLLRRLAREAPGTYAHSINVANLSEAAALAIGANALLTRVGVYYHDVGKIGRPHYFIENQPGHRNPHDKLKPATSAQMVRNHVLDGMKLAEEEKLPDSVKAFILEHHGTQPIGFFYDQARASAPEGDEVDVRDYAYPGPKPQSRETAILMLADSVESAARVLHEPSPESIRELVDRIVRTKIEAGQLDETPLTLSELNTIKQEFVSVLGGMYHQRIDYPSNRGGTGPAAEPAGEREPDAVEPSRAGAP